MSQEVCGCEALNVRGLLSCCRPRLLGRDTSLESQQNPLGNCPFRFWETVLRSNLLCWGWNYLVGLSLGCQQNPVGYCAPRCWWHFPGRCFWNAGEKGLKFKTCQRRESQWKLRCSTEFWVGSHKTAYDPDVAIAEKMHFPIWDDIFVHRKYYRNKQTNKQKNSVIRKKRCRLKFGYS